MPIDTTTRHRLLTLARTALQAHLAREARPRVPLDLMVEAFGVFVTLRVNGDLRGCLGSLDCTGSITSEIVRLAAAVASDDHRFTPLARRELPAATLDLSVLTPPEAVLDFSTIEVGRHGLIVEQGRHRGLLLPQVALEHGWDRDTFLMHTCVKAGLHAAAWQQGVVVMRFEAEVFSDEVR
jgi:AmmeMemoRadiSam system protein A